MVISILGERNRDWIMNDPKCSDLGWVGSWTTRNAAISSYLPKMEVRVLAVVSQPRPWMEILQWAGSTSASSRTIWIKSGCLLTPFLIRAIRWSFMNGSRSFSTSSSSLSSTVGFVFVFLCLVDKKRARKC